MQLRLSRTQKEAGGLLGGKSLIFCLDAKAEFTPEEKNNIKKYKLGEQEIYNSENSKKHTANMVDSANRGGLGLLTAGVHLAMSKMSLNITINKLVQGTHVECKDMNELFGAQVAIFEACENIKSFLDAAATFDGKEEVYDFDKMDRTGNHPSKVSSLSDRREVPGADPRPAL